MSVQNLQALERANAVRLARADLKRRLHEMTAREARTHVAGVLVTPPAWARTMRLAELLRAIPRLGQHHISHGLAVRRISESRTVGALTARQAVELATVLRTTPTGLPTAFEEDQRCA